MKIPVKKIVLYVLLGLGALWVVSLISVIILFHVFFATYKNTKEGFEMLYPRGWKIVENGGQGVVVAFVSPKENPLDLLQENISLTYTDISQTPMTLDEYTEFAVKQTQGTFAKMEFKGAVDQMVAGRQMRRLLFLAKGEPPIAIAVYVFIEHGTAYNLTYLGNAERFMKRDVYLLVPVVHMLKVKF